MFGRTPLLKAMRNNAKMSREKHMNQVAGSSTLAFFVLAGRKLQRHATNAEMRH
jgi:hypothetical protein